MGWRTLQGREKYFSFTRKKGRARRWPSIPQVAKLLTRMKNEENPLDLILIMVAGACQGTAIADVYLKWLMERRGTIREPKIGLLPSCLS